jgi:hypothetical protein
LPGAAELLKENGTHPLTRRSELPVPQKDPKKIEFYRILQKPTEMKRRE